MAEQGDADESGGPPEGTTQVVPEADAAAKDATRKPQKRNFFSSRKRAGEDDGQVSETPAIEADPIKAPVWVGLLGALIVFAVAALEPFIPHPAAGETAYWSKVLPLFCAEIGVALMVAYIIGWGIDEQAKRREQRIQAQRREAERLRQALEKQAAEAREERERQEILDRERRMTQDVFRGVLGIQHSSAYVRRVIESTLDRKIIRRHVMLMYKLTRLTEQDAKELGILNPAKFMFLDQAFTFEFENLSSQELHLPVKFALPARHGTKLRDASRVLSAKIGGEAQDVDAALGGDMLGDAKVYTWPKSIEPHGKLSVAVTARVIKEDSDSEVWCSYYPCTEGMSLQVTGPNDLHMGMRNNTASPETQEMPDGGNGMAIWKIDGPILPNNSVVFYWRTPEHDGDAVVSDATTPRGESATPSGTGTAEEAAVDES